MNPVIVSLEILFKAFAKYNKRFWVDITAMQRTNKLVEMRQENGCVLRTSDWFLETFPLNERLRKKEKKFQLKFYYLEY